MPVRSMVAPLRRVAVRPPSVVGDYALAHWGMPLDLARLQDQHAAFTQLLRELGCNVEVLPMVEDMPDACFVYDPVFVTGRGAIELRSAKSVRAGEPPVLAAELAGLDVPTIGRLAGGATADGGDMFWLDEYTLAVGRSYRTNQAAVDQLREILAQEDASVEVFDVPHDNGPEFCLHLMSVVSPIRGDLAVVYERLAPVALIQALRSRGVEILALPEADYPSLGCNVLTIEPGVVVLAKGNTATKRALEDRGVRVHEYDASEINKGEGGPTCLTRPLDRSV
jgi:N-dimethylarginine dimethylaminohydrolase